MKRKRKWVLLGILALFVVALLCTFSGFITSNPHNYKTIGDISTPIGYERVKGDDPAYAEFLRSLPLKRRGEKVQLFTGGNADWQIGNYAVINLPLLSNWEQCADVCMRLRAEYLFQAKKYNGIHFKSFKGKTMQYSGGSSRKAFEDYLRRVYTASNTCTLRNELKTRPLKDIQPGDIFVYQASSEHKVGHAVMVVDVAVNKNGEKAFLIAEGNTPANEIHVLHNIKNPFRSPWYILDEDASFLRLPIHKFKPEDLRHF